MKLKKRPKKLNRADSAYIWPDEEEFSLAVKAIQTGGIVAIPTESFYGLAVDPMNEQALRKLFLLKRRDPAKPVLVIISEIQQLNNLVAEIPDCYVDLMNRFWPGPLTLLFTASSQLPFALTGGTGTVGIRFTSHPIAQQLISSFGGPVTATSANISGGLPAQTVSELDPLIMQGVDAVLSGGKTPGGLCSTIVGRKDSFPCVKRLGQIDLPGIPLDLQ